MVEKSKVEAEVAFLRLLRPLIASINWFVVVNYPKSVNACKKPTLFIICLYLTKKQTKN